MALDPGRGGEDERGLEEREERQPDGPELERQFLQLLDSPQRHHSHRLLLAGVNYIQRFLLCR
jgi:hypothetical protein